MNVHLLKVGDALPPFASGAMTRHRIALYAHGSCDLNPIHVDSDYARDTAGLPDVIVHGMFTMGAMSRLVTQWAGPGSVRTIDTRFEAIVAVRQSIACRGSIVAIDAADGGALVTVGLEALIDDGTRVASGSAVVFLRAPPPA